MGCGAPVEEVSIFCRYSQVGMIKCVIPDCYQYPSRFNFGCSQGAKFSHHEHIILAHFGRCWVPLLFSVNFLPHYLVTKPRNTLLSSLLFWTGKCILNSIVVFSYVVRYNANRWSPVEAVCILPHHQYRFFNIYFKFSIPLATLQNVLI